MSSKATRLPLLIISLLTLTVATAAAQQQLSANENAWELLLEQGQDLADRVVPLGAHCWTLT